MALQGVYGLGAQASTAPSAQQERQDVPGADIFAELLAMATHSVAAPQGVVPSPAAAANPSATTPAGSKADEKPADKSALHAFLDYMSKSPMERWREAWLTSHKLSEGDLEAMSPEKRAAIEKHMAEDMKEEIRRSAEKQAAKLHP